MATGQVRRQAYRRHPGSASGCSHVMHPAAAPSPANPAWGGQATKRCFRLIRSDLWQDPQNLRDCLDRALALADAIKLSEEELAFISGSDDIVSGIARLNARFQPTLLLVTQGKAGVQAALRGQVSHFPARPVVAVDTTGAGDAFVAGLLAGLAAHGIPDNLAALAPDLALAQTCGALATTAKGAMTALPYRDDLQRSL